MKEFPRQVVKWQFAAEEEERLFETESYHVDSVKVSNLATIIRSHNTATRKINTDSSRSRAHLNSRFPYNIEERTSEMLGQRKREQRTLIDKKLRYREEHSVSVVLSWCTLWPDAENRMIVSSFVWTKHRDVTEWRTDGNDLAITAVCMASHADAL